MEIYLNGVADEHKEVPFEIAKNYNVRTPGQPLYCTYATFKTEGLQGNITVAVVDYLSGKKFSTVIKRGWKIPNILINEPIWDFIERDREPEVQEFINNNYAELNEAIFKEMAKAGF